MRKGRLPKLKAAEVERILLRHGFVCPRSKGSHRKYKKGSLTVTVPFHGRGGELPPGTLNNIIKSSGIPRKEFR